MALRPLASFERTSVIGITLPFVGCWTKGVNPYYTMPLPLSNTLWFLLFIFNYEKKKSFLLVFKFYSEIVFFCVSSCDFGAPVGEVEFRVFLLHPLVSLCFLFVCIFVLFFCYSSVNELRQKLRQKVGILL